LDAVLSRGVHEDGPGEPKNFGYQCLESVIAEARPGHGIPGFRRIRTDAGAFRLDENPLPGGLRPRLEGDALARKILADRDSI